MFQFAFDGALFKIEANTPAEMPLFTLPPHWSARTPDGERSRNSPPESSYQSLYASFILLNLSCLLSCASKGANAPLQPP